MAFKFTYQLSKVGELVPDPTQPLVTVKSPKSCPTFARTMLSREPAGRFWLPLVE